MPGAKPLLPKFQRFRALGKYETKKWTDNDSIYKRLPEFYKKQHADFLNKMPEPVHYVADKRKYMVDHWTGEKKIVQNFPVDVIYPKQAYLGLWGGEGIVPGMLRPRQTGYKRPSYLTTKLWRPKLMKSVFYSEILNRYYALIVTPRTYVLIEHAKGFDHYILKTHEADLKSEIGMQLKREMLIALAKKDTDLWPNDKDKREAIYNRYKNYELPLEQAEWVGLKPWDAMKKQKAIEEEQMKDSIRPWKEKYQLDLMSELEKLQLENKEFPLDETMPTPEKKNIFSKAFGEFKSKK